jgi:hypothetical protein
VVGDSVTMKNGVLLWSGVTIEEVLLGPSAVFTNDAGREHRSPRARPAADLMWRGHGRRQRHRPVLPDHRARGDGRRRRRGPGGVAGHALAVGNPAHQTAGRACADGPGPSAYR